MRIMNLIWGFTLGAGIDKCFLTYATIHVTVPIIEVQSVCIQLQNKNTDVLSLKNIKANIISVKNKQDFSWIKKLAILINTSKPDIIFTHGFNGAIIILIEHIFMGIKTPVICSYHGKYHGPTIKKKILEPFYNKLTIYIYKHIAKKVICVENYSYQYLLRKGIPENKLVVVHNGIKNYIESTRIKLSDFNIKNDAVIIITSSRITEVKGLTFLLEAISIAKEKTSSNFHYIMMGDGPDLEKLKKQSLILGISDIIFFLGFQKDVTPWLNVADIFVLPSLMEYHSISLLEAMRAGKAIIATDVGGNTESIRNRIEGILVPPGNSEMLADAIVEMIDNPVKRVAYSKAAQERFLKNFTEEEMHKSIVKVFRL